MTNSLPYAYWLADKKDAEHQEKCAALEPSFQVLFFTKTDDLLRQLTIIRPDTIIFSTRASSADCINDINLICRNPEAKGLKMLLSIEREDPSSIHLAASLCFRDILPINLSLNIWLKRFKFATSSKSHKIAIPNQPANSIQQAVIRAPSRINWIEKDRICIETSMFFDPGCKFNLLGPFSVFLGAKELPLTVIERQSKRLRYRHSSSIICKINTDEIVDFNTAKLQNIARGQSTNAPMNIYAVAKTQTGRQQIISAFGQHNVLFATKMVTAAKEVEFFDPDALIIEESFLQNKDIQKLIGGKLTCILTDPEGSLFLTPSNANLKTFTQVLEIHKYLQLKIPMNQRAKDAKWYIPEVNDFSRCSVQFNGSVEQINKDTVIVNSPNRARAFSLVEIMVSDDNASGATSYVKLCDQIPGHDGQVATSFVSMVLCSSHDALAESNEQVAKVIEYRGSKNKDRLSTPRSSKGVVLARPTSQIAPGHEFYEKEVLRDVRIEYKKPSTYQNIMKSLDRKTLIQAFALITIGSIFIYLLHVAIENPNTSMNGFSRWYSERAAQSGK